jgi:hypothetical protein
MRRWKSAYPLPGGYDAQLRTLATVVDWVSAHKPDVSAAEAQFVTRFSMSARNAQLALLFLYRAGFLTLSSGVIEPTPTAAQWRSTDDPRIVVEALHTHIRFIGEMLACLTEPRRLEEILVIANRNYSLAWESIAQVNIRRGWLQSAGAIAVDGDGRLVATDVGRSQLTTLQLERSHSRDAMGESRTVESIGLGAGTENPVAAQSAMADLGQPTDDLESRLRSAARMTSQPAEFEHAVAEAFRDLGFETTNLGGSGKTDILLVAPLARPDAYRVIVDCKTTTHEAVQDLPIDWVTLSEHRKKHEADFVAVVAGSFGGARVRSRAREQKVILIDLDGLISWRRQHVRVPMGLDAYRSIFAAEDFDAGIGVVAEEADFYSRIVGIAAAALNLIRGLEGTEGPVTARDIYWNIRRDERFEGVTADELESILEPLSSPPTSLLRKVGEGYKSLGSTTTQQARLRRLADALVRI